MNNAEKLASTYLRLNGFLTLPHFTAFAQTHHNHIDMVALRAPNSREQVGRVSLITDDALFRKFMEVCPGWDKSALLGLVAEVRSNKNRDVPNEEHVRYASKFLGDVDLVRIAFFEGPHEIVVQGDTLDIGLRYAARWIATRVNWMEQNIQLSKEASWTLSEDYLSDFLSLRKLGLLAV